MKYWLTYYLFKPFRFIRRLHMTYQGYKALEQFYEQDMSKATRDKIYRMITDIQGAGDKMKPNELRLYLMGMMNALSSVFFDEVDYDTLVHTMSDVFSIAYAEQEPAICPLIQDPIKFNFTKGELKVITEWHGFDPSIFNQKRVNK